MPSQALSNVSSFQLSQMQKLFFLSIVSNAKPFFPFYSLKFKTFFSFLFSQIQKLFFLSILSNSKPFFPFYSFKFKTFFSFLFSEIQTLFFLAIVSNAYNVQAKDIAKAEA